MESCDAPEGLRWTGLSGQSALLGSESRTALEWGSHARAGASTNSRESNASVTCTLFREGVDLPMQHLPNRPSTPSTKGKAGRFIQTLCRERAYAMVSRNSEERNRLLPWYLSIYNHLRKHSDPGWR
jgi:hypothetical protein